MKNLTSLLEAARTATRFQRRIALVVLVGLLLLVPSLPVVVLVPAAAVATWAAAQPLLVGMGLGAYVLHRRQKVGAR